MPAAANRPYGGVSAEDRRADRRARLLDACLDAVADGGAAAVTADDVCVRAGLSKRYFYESFTDRDAILTAALGALYEDVRVAITAAITGTGDDRRTRIERTVGALVDTLSADRRRARLYVEAPGHPTMRAARDLAIDAFVRLIVEDVLALDAGDPRSRVTTLIVVAGTTEAVTRWLAGHIALDRDALVAQIVAVGFAVDTTGRIEG